MAPNSHYKLPTLSFVRHLLPLSAALLLLYLLLSPNPTLTITPLVTTPSPTSLRHLVFGIASSASSLPRRHSYLRLWYRLNLTRAHIFLDALPPSPSSPDLPPVHLSSPTARFPYTYTGGRASAIRVARIVKDLIPLSPPDTRWIVLGDDDTLFFPDNLAATLGKYDWEQWWYVGGRSESVEQNVKYSFGMAFGGGGIAISYPLAKVLAGLLDSCLMRYGHLYGSDARIFACLTELGVGLTYEPGFHQVDLRGNLFGMLSVHPLSPLVSLHHLDYVDPLFPGMNRLTAVFEGNMLLPDILSSQKTFTPWKRSRNISSSLYMFDTREFPRDPCKRSECTRRNLI